MKVTRVSFWPGLIAALVLTLVAFAGVYTQFRVFRIPYHQNRMNSDLDAHYEAPEEFGGMVGHVYGDDWKSFERHRDALVELGVISHFRERLNYIKADTPEYKHLSRTLVNCLEEGSPVPEFVGECTWNDKSGVLTVEVWCYPEHDSQWVAFLGSRNVADYRRAFMKGDRSY